MRRTALHAVAFLGLACCISMAAAQPDQEIYRADYNLVSPAQAQRCDHDNSQDAEARAGCVNAAAGQNLQDFERRIRPFTTRQDGYDKAVLVGATQACGMPEADVLRMRGILSRDMSPDIVAAGMAAGRRVFAHVPEGTCALVRDMAMADLVMQK